MQDLQIHAFMMHGAQRLTSSTEWKQSATAISTAVRNDTGLTFGKLTLILAARASRLFPPVESACRAPQ